MPEYTFLEPLLGFELPVDGVFLKKNIETELTFDITIRLSTTPHDQPELNIDYKTNITAEGSQITFLPNEERLSVFGQDLSVYILSDAIREDKEVLEISSSPVNNPGPAYRHSLGRSVASLNIVESECTCIIRFVLHYSLYNTYVRLYLFAYRHHSWLGSDLLYCV